MRPIRSLYLWCAPALLSAASACGKDSSGPDLGGNNAAPTAEFASSCTGLTCSFTNLSSDNDGQVTAYAWEFGDGDGANTKNPNHAFASGGTFSVKLTVTDNLASQGTRTKIVSVSGPQSGAPTADFSVSSSSLDCTFQDLVAWAQEFGDGATSTEQSPAHHYDATVRTLYAAKLTVTDNNGLTSSKTTEVTVSPPAALQCEDAPGTGHYASCALVLDAAATW